MERRSSTRDVSPEVAERIQAVIHSHPLYAEATGWPHCVGDAFVRDKSFIKRIQIPELERERIEDALSDVESVILHVFWTAAAKPEPLSGVGRLYGFLIHPKSFDLLHADVGQWRS